MIHIDGAMPTFSNLTMVNIIQPIWFFFVSLLIIGFGSLSSLTIWTARTHPHPTESTCGRWRLTLHVWWLQVVDPSPPREWRALMVALDYIAGIIQPTTIFLHYHLRIRQCSESHNKKIIRKFQTIYITRYVHKLNSWKIPGLCICHESLVNKGQVNKEQFLVLHVFRFLF